ncbi:hypothetical protein ARMSODRAFT_1043998 [Armillaria solidipes]|uniref:Uncharacterized protein n=1 Tax=Armillaria solidipes TaxID=1076256 RepID=A0A2H3BE33_9AGAR|nr:hypothetical protein ARMSODRAFT_1043998 [Armillaria solidipes]
MLACSCWAFLILACLLMSDLSRSREEDNALVEKEDRLSSSNRCNSIWQDSAATESADSILLTKSQPRYLKVVQLKAGSGCITFMRDLLPHDNFSDSHFVTSEESASHDLSGPFSSLDLQKKRNVNSFDILSLLDRSGRAPDYPVSGCKILTSHSTLPGHGKGVAGNLPMVIGRGSYRGFVLPEEEKNVDILLLHFAMASLEFQRRILRENDAHARSHQTVSWHEASLLTVKSIGHPKSSVFSLPQTGISFGGWIGRHAQS